MFIQMREKRMTHGLVIAAMACLIPSIASAGIVIDDFTNDTSLAPWLAPQTTVGSSWIIDSNLTGAIKTTRLTTLAASFIGNPNFDAITPTLDTVNGELNYQSTLGADGGIAMSYGQVGAPITLDLSSESGLQLDFSSIVFGGQGAANLGFGAGIQVTTLISDGVNSAIGSRGLIIEGAQSVAFNFNNFSSIASVDLTNIKLVAFQVDTAFGTDFVMTQFSTFVVPAPGGLMVMGMMGMFGSRRRRK